MTGERLRILVSGMIAGTPGQGGASWAVLQYLVGLSRLGHEVFFVEPVASSQIQPEGCSLPRSANAAYFEAVMQQFGLDDASALLDGSGHAAVGLSDGALAAAAADCDLLLNLSGLLSEADLLERIPIRVYVDLDPGFTQLWSAVQGIDMRFDAHTHFVTVGQAIGQDGCAVPTCGVKWLGTPPPVVLDEWPRANEIVHDSLTTVANWRGYGSIEHQGRFFGQKAHSLRELISLPLRTSEIFSPALAIHAEETRDLEALESNGWRLLDPGKVAGTPVDYRRFVAGSKAEFGFAKSGYVEAKAGWFSDRSSCYLASGRPVIAQDTCFTSFLPTGEGLFSFATPEDVLGAIEALNSDYGRHARAAREIAEQYLSSDRVLGRLLDEIGGSL